MKLMVKIIVFAAAYKVVDKKSLSSDLQASGLPRRNSKRLIFSALIKMEFTEMRQPFTFAILGQSSPTRIKLYTAPTISSLDHKIMEILQFFAPHDSYMTFISLSNSP